jgi:ABC-2 type transport system permease protein
MIRGIWIIFRREMVSTLTTPYAYLIAAAFFVVSGLAFTNDLTTSVTVRTANTAAVPEFLSFAMVFFAPLLTMRMLAEETREGTMELLLTAPVSDSAIVIGKFLSAWMFYTLLLLVTLGYQLFLINLDIFPDLGRAVAAYMGIWLYGGATLSVGLMFSATTDSQIVAGFLSMSTLLLLWLGDNIGNIVADFELAQLIRELTLQGHFSTSFAAGIFRAEDVVFFVGIMAVMLFMAIRIIESRRWR